MIHRFVAAGLCWLLAGDVAAQDSAISPLQQEATSSAEPAHVVTRAPPATTLPAPPAELDYASASPAPSWQASLNPLSRMQIHGFVSEGGFVSTANDYIGNSSRGSLKFFEAGINFSTELLDKLRVGLQLVSRSVGDLSQEVPRIDWAVIDYPWWPWLGIRAGVIKMPLGLYNEYIAIDAARTAILLPQALYPLRNRDALISHTGFALYGSIPIAAAGSLDYQVWLGTLTIPRSALELDGASLQAVDTKYVTGAQAFWRPPIEGLRFGATYLRTSIDFHLQLDPGLPEQVVMQGLAPAGYGGELVVAHRPAAIWVASAEYSRGDWLFAAEYSRWLKHEQSSLPALIPTHDEDQERFYAMASYRLSSHFELGSYFSMVFADADDRRDRRAPFAEHARAFQRDLAATLRLDVNEYWLWKLEGHYLAGAAELLASTNPTPERHWGLFLLRTTVTF